MNTTNISTSVIIPTFNDFSIFKKLIISIENQTLLPDEVIVIDSSYDDDIDNFIDISNFSFKIIYKRFFPKNKNSNLFPGHARNLGFSFSKFNYLVFLDTKTLPENNWLEVNLNLLIISKKDFTIGVTKYYHSNNFNKILLYSTYGHKLIQTLPGSIVHRNFFKDNLFIEEVRSGEDLEWKNRILKNDKDYLVNKIALKYSSLPKNIFQLLKKYFLYNINGAFLDVQNNQKDAYLSILLIASLFIIPRWNYYLSNWDESLFYIPNITKYYLLSLFFLFTMFIFLKNILINKLKLKFFSFTVKILIFLFIFYSAYKWNDIIGNLTEFTFLYIPHVTKIFIFIVLFSSLSYRGIFLPLKNKIKINNLFPFKWILIGLMGLTLDLIKAPGLLLGSVISLFNFKFIFKIKK